MSRNPPGERRPSRLRHKILEIALKGSLAMLVVPVVQADNGRDFSALYDFGSGHLIDSAHVSVSLYLSLQNHGAAGVTNTALVLGQPGLLEAKSTQVAANVTVAHRAIASISGTMTIRAQDYQRWQRGQWTPLLYIRITDAQGRQIYQQVELARRPGLGAHP
jgi:hypothetical protein